MDPLAELQDIHLPEAASWWPLAPGWIVLIALLMIAIGFFGTRWVLAYRKNRYRRAALTELEQLASELNDEAHAAATLQATNALLKRVALRAYPREDVAALNGAAWARFLIEQGKLEGRSADTAQGLAESAYQDPSQASLQKVSADVIELARLWIRRHA